jgi:hypothetical protein
MLFKTEQGNLLIAPESAEETEAVRLWLLDMGVPWRWQTSEYNSAWGGRQYIQVIAGSVKNCEKYAAAFEMHLMRLREMPLRIEVALLPEEPFEDDVDNKPHFRNEHNFKPHEYIGSVNVLERENGKLVQNWYDVYVFGPKGHVSLRFGNEGHEYLSPGSVLDMLIAKARHEHELNAYGAALRLILDNGRVVYQPMKRAVES